MLTIDSYGLEFFESIEDAFELHFSGLWPEDFFDLDSRWDDCDVPFQLRNLFGGFILFLAVEKQAAL